jgi:ankyrin repeat protein
MMLNPKSQVVFLPVILALAISGCQHPSGADHPKRIQRNSLEVQELACKALALGSLPLFDSALKRGLDPNAPLLDLGSPLALAIRFCRTDMLERMLIAGGDPRVARGCIDDKTVDLLSMAISECPGSIADGCVGVLLRYGMPLEPAAVDTSPLHAAVIAYRPQIVQLLLTAGVSPNRRDSAGYTPLIWLCQMEADDQGEPEQAAPIARMLLEAGADPAAKTPWGESAAEMMKEVGLGSLLGGE